MILRCPTCSGGFDVEESTLAGRATLVCPLCRRVVVVREAGTVAASKEATVPFDPGTEAALEPATPADEKTALPAAGLSLALPSGGRVAVAILTGPRKGDVVALAAPRLVLGRSGGGADLELPDAEVSRQHAAVLCYGSRVVLRDLGSRNGTFVGDERVEERELEDRTEFRLGSTGLLLVVTR